MTRDERWHVSRLRERRNGGFRAIGSTDSSDLHPRSEGVLGIRERGEHRAEAMKQRALTHRT